MSDTEIGNLVHHYTPNSFHPELDELKESGLEQSPSGRRYKIYNICYHVPTNVFRVGGKVTDISSINYLKMMIWEKQREIFYSLLKSKDIYSLAIDLIPDELGIDVTILTKNNKKFSCKFCSLNEYKLVVFMMCMGEKMRVSNKIPIQEMVQNLEDFLSCPQKD